MFTHHSFLSKREQNDFQGQPTREIMKGDKLGRQGGSGSQEQPRKEIMKGDKLGRQGGSGSQEHGRQGGSGSQEQPRREIMKRDKLGRQGGSGITTIWQFWKLATQSLRSKNLYAFQLSGENKQTSTHTVSPQYHKILSASW